MNTKKTAPKGQAKPCPPSDSVMVPRAALRALMEAAFWPFIMDSMPPGLSESEAFRRIPARQYELRERFKASEVAAHPFPLDRGRFLEALAELEAGGSPALAGKGANYGRP